MATSKNPPLLLRSRRATNKWIREHLSGECFVSAVSPSPIIWSRHGDALPRPAPRVGTVEISVRPRDLPAHTRVTARRYRIRVTKPRQWVARAALELPFSFFSDAKSKAIGAATGIDCGPFWFSGDEMTVHEIGPEIQMVAPVWRPKFYSYSFDDLALMPTPEDWIEFASECGYQMALVDHQGFVIPPGATAKPSFYLGWQFAERAPRNLLHPLAFSIRFEPGGHFSILLTSFYEEERGDALKAMLRRRCERIPGLVIQSGNCRFTADEWHALQARATEDPKAAPERRQAGDDGEGAVIFSLDDRRRRS